MQTRKKRKKINYEFLIQFALLVGLIPILYQLFIIEETIRDWINKPQTVIFTNIGYYKCGGTNKNPKFCPIILKEKFEEE
jgi:hypothetical protein